jgi:YVTN family beta-propeller protein
MPTKLSRLLRSIALAALAFGVLVSVPGGAAAQPSPYLAVTHTSGRVARFDPENIAILQDAASAGNYEQVVASPDGRRFYMVNLAPMGIRVVHTSNLGLVSHVPLTQQPLDIAITPDGSSVWVSLGGDQSVAVIDTATLTVTATIPLGMSGIGVAITPDGQHALVTGDQARMAVIDVATRTVAGSIPMTSTGNQIAVHPTGDKAYVSQRVA